MSAEGTEVSRAESDLCILSLSSPSVENSNVKNPIKNAQKIFKKY